LDGRLDWSDWAGGWIGRIGRLDGRLDGRLATPAVCGRARGPAWGMKTPPGRAQLPSPQASPQKHHPPKGIPYPPNSTPFQNTPPLNQIKPKQTNPPAHLCGARAPHHLHDLRHCGAPHDGVVYEQHRLAAKHGGHGVELAAHAHLAHALWGVGKVLGGERLAEFEGGLAPRWLVRGMVGGCGGVAVGGGKRGRGCPRYRLVEPRSRPPPPNSTPPNSTPPNSTPPEQHPSEQHPSKQHPSEQHPSETTPLRTTPLRTTPTPPVQTPPTQTPPPTWSGMMKVRPTYLFLTRPSR
jgi:hypothetical protein